MPTNTMPTAVVSSSDRDEIAKHYRYIGEAYIAISNVWARSGNDSESPSTDATSTTAAAAAAAVAASDKPTSSAGTDVSEALVSTFTKWSNVTKAKYFFPTLRQNRGQIY
jgi:hypothetical protein